MIDPITALAAISSAVQLVKKVSKTVDDVTSLGPVLGKYFDAKEQAIEVVKQAKDGGFKGSALGKALELEMALEQAREFEEQVKMLFFQSNKMDVWASITARAKQMEVDAAHASRRRKDAEKRKSEEMEEAITLVIGGVVALASAGVIVWVIIQIVTGSVK
jgi:L-lactate utilization protein LutC